MQNNNQKRALGALISAGIATISVLVNTYLKTPTEVQASVYGFIAALAAYWQIDVTPPEA